MVSGIVLAASGSNTGQRVYVLTDNAALKAMLGVNQEFPSAFSTQVSAQVKALQALGLIKTKPVQFYKLLAPPNMCGDGVCQGHESPETCSQDCGGSGECYPNSQKPWGIVKVKGGSGGEGIKVAVLDTGVDTDHPDLIGNIVDCTGFVYATSCEDSNGHGTHVAGTVLANGKILGVAPGASLMAVKVCGPTGCWGDDVAAGIYYAADNGADIISMSLGGDNPDPFVTPAVDYAVNKGVLVVAAAGNDREDGIGSIDYPGAYQDVVAVAAFDSSDKMANFSSLGINDGDWIIEEKEIEFTAPGVYVESTYNDGCYGYMSGTSMATPHITGIAARDWQGSASATRTYLQGLAKTYTESIFDYGQAGDDIEAGFGLPIVSTPQCQSNGRYCNCNGKCGKFESNATCPWDCPL